MSVFDHSHNRFSLKHLGRRLEALPALLVLIPVVVGILLHEYAVLHWGLTVVLLATALVASIVFRYRAYAPLFVVVALVAFGYVVTELRSVRSDIPYDADLELMVGVESIPIERNGYRISEGVVTAWRGDGAWHEVDSRVMLWLHSDSVGEGDRLRFHGSVRERISRFEPYDKLLHRRGFVGGVGVDSSLVVASERGDLTLHSRAVRHLEQYMRDSVSYATAEAMVVGSRRMITPELRKAYSSTGLSHLMAVSGLHLGIVMLVVGWLLRPIVVVHRGVVVYRVLIIVALWVFAVMSGGSPSVLRAALMFSVLQLADLISRSSWSLNTLAAIVVAMLIYRPDYLYDISFQLSVVAVAGIVVWGVPIVRRVGERRGPMSWLWSTIIISVVATLWSMPLVSHTFGTVPIVGVIVAPVVMLTAYLILGFGVVTLLLPAPLAEPFAWCMERSAWLQNIIVERASWWPWASLEYQMSGAEVAAVYALFALATLCGWMYREKKVVTLSVDDFEH